MAKIGLSGKILLTIMKRFFGFAFVVLLTNVLVLASAEQWKLASPDGRLVANVTVENGTVHYALQHGSTAVLAKSDLAMRLSNGKTLGKGMTGVRAVRSKRRVNVATPVYRKARVDEQCNVLTLKTKDYDVEFEAYNQGLAYRFCTRMAKPFEVVDESNYFAFAGNDAVWHMPVGNMATAFEGEYQHKPVLDIKNDELLAPQMVIELADGKRALLSDYNVKDYPTMYLKAKGQGMTSVFPGYPKTEEAYGTNKSRMRVASRENYIARCSGTRAFPWKMILVADGDAQLLTTDLPVCLADPCEVKDVSWIRPGKVAWEWWNACNLKGVDFRTGVNNDTYKRYIDFASKNGIEYIMMDAGWTKPQEPLDLLKTIDAINIPELVAYGKQRNVGIILWADYHPLDLDMERVIKTYAEMGIKGFKIDHINRNDQKVVDFVWRAAKMCAKYKLLVDFHGVFPPTGLQYTYPNVLNFEAVKGLETVKWTKKYDGVTHECIVPFVRQVVGPMDYTQGAMRNVVMANYAPVSSQPMSQGTRCRQLAEYVIFESPMNMLCDSPSNYEANQPCTDFIAGVPVVWDETRVLDAKIGEYIIEARRKGNVWYVGGLTDWTARDVTIDLGFTGGSSVVLYADGVNADRNAEDYKVATRQLTGGKLTVHLAPGGGFAGMVK